MWWSAKSIGAGWQTTYYEWQLQQLGERMGRCGQWGLQARLEWRLANQREERVVAIQKSRANGVSPIVLRLSCLGFKGNR
jgi:hypothetical protein